MNMKLKSKKMVYNIIEAERRKGAFVRYELLFTGSS